MRISLIFYSPMPCIYELCKIDLGPQTNLIVRISFNDIVQILALESVVKYGDKYAKKKAIKLITLISFLVSKCACGHRRNFFKCASLNWVI